jgi:hypothetical protein
MIDRRKDRPMSTCTETDGTFHTHDATIWFRLAYGTPLPLWRVIPHRLMTRACPTWANR